MTTPQVRRPRYQSLADQLVSRIDRGEFSVGDKLPTEFELCSEFQLSRGTVRQALRCLEDAGMINRSTTGTIVAAKQPVDAYHASAGSSEEIMDLVLRTKLHRPTTGEVVADRVLAARLGVDVRSRWYFVSGPLVLRSDPTTTLCWSEHYHRDVEGQRRFRRGDYHADSLEGLIMEQVISAEPLREEYAAQLGAPPGVPALVVRRTAFHEAERPSKVSIYTHRGDLHRVRTTFRPSEISRSAG